jgi:hypothetical protein
VQWDALLGLGDFKMKKKKKHFLMDRFFYCPLFHFIFMSLLVMALNFCGSMFLSFFQFCGPTKGLTIHKKNEPN